MLAAGLLLGGCAARLPVDRQAGMDPVALLEAPPLVAGGTVPVLPREDPFALDADMRRFLAEHIDPTRPSQGRLEQLLTAVIGDPRFSVAYDDSTRSATEVFRARRGNCLSFAAMVIALAREAGIDASFQEVDVPADWALGAGTLVVMRHVNVLVPSRHGTDRIVDFDMVNFRASYDRRVISDARARAHYHSNLAAERLQADEPLAALAELRQALADDAGFAPAWVNLGTLYLREGHTAWARAAWWQALVVSPDEEVAISNLERSYRDAGELALADTLLERVGHFRMSNPYYRYFLAQQALEARNTEEAIRHLRFAVQRKPAEDRFLALLGLSYLRRGDVDEARRWLAQAQAVVADPALRERYQGKLERLRRDGSG